MSEFAMARPYLTTWIVLALGGSIVTLIRGHRASAR